MKEYPPSLSSTSVTLRREQAAKSSGSIGSITCSGTAMHQQPKPPSGFFYRYTGVLPLQLWKPCRDCPAHSRENSVLDPSSPAAHHYAILTPATTTSLSEEQVLHNLRENSHRLHRFNNATGSSSFPVIPDGAAPTFLGQQRRVFYSASFIQLPSPIYSEDGGDSTARSFHWHFWRGSSTALA